MLACGGAREREGCVEETVHVD